MARKKSTRSQMEMFKYGGLKDQGETVDQQSNNPVPVGSIKKEVRDDIPANLSEGEFVLPADVVRYHGLEKIMGFRDQAKQGLDRMNQMGQMGNSNEATLSDSVSFKPRMAVGGLTPTVQTPTIQAPTVIPEQVPGVQYNPATPQGLRPSVYSYGNQMPKVDRDPTESDVDVKIPDAIQYGAQARPAYRQATNTAATPDFNKLLGTQFGQLQKSETRKYVNPETKEELYIPFVNGEPIYPIPTGFIPSEDVKEEEAKEKAGELKTTSVRQDSEGGDNSTMGQSGFESQASRDEQADIAGAGNMSQSQNLGVMGNLSNAISNMSVNPTSVLGGLLGGPIGAVIGMIGSAIGGSKSEAKGISTSVQSDRLGSLGYNTQAEKSSLASQLGLDLSNVQTMALGHNPGNRNSNDPNSVYSGRGISVNVNQNSPSYGSVNGYSNATSAVNAVTAMASVGYYGEIEAISNMGAYSVTNPGLFGSMNNGRDALGLGTVTAQQAQEALGNQAVSMGAVDSKGNPNFGQELGPGIGVTANGTYSGGSFTTNNMGGKSVIGYSIPGRGTTFATTKNGTLTNMTNPFGKTNVTTPTTTKGKSVNTSPTVTTPTVEEVTTANEFSGLGTGVGAVSVTDPMGPSYGFDEDVTTTNDSNTSNNNTSNNTNTNTDEGNTSGSSTSNQSTNEAGYGGGGDGSESGSSDSGSHICTATYNNGYIDKEHFTTLRKYGILLRRNDPYMMKAYDMFGPTLASYVHKNKYMTSFAKFITQYYKDTMDNRQLSIRQNIFKFISNNILRPTYRIVGWTAVKLSK
jgi:hypothetical protein